MDVPSDGVETPSTLLSCRTSSLGGVTLCSRGNLRVLALSNRLRSIRQTFVLKRVGRERLLAEIGMFPAEEGAQRV